MNLIDLHLFFFHCWKKKPSAVKECNSQPFLEIILSFLKEITVIPKEMSPHSFMFCGFSSLYECLDLVTFLAESVAITSIMMTYLD